MLAESAFLSCFPHDLARIFVIPERKELGVPKFIGSGPLGEIDSYTTSGFNQMQPFIFSAVKPCPHRPSDASGRFANGHLGIFRPLNRAKTSRRVAGTNPARTRAANIKSLPR